jgi:hypothetical protein
MICQSWKVMFQAEYSSGSPLRMLVDLRASVEHALGRGKAAPEAKGTAAVPNKPVAAPKPTPKAPMANAAAAGANAAKPHAPAEKPTPKPVAVEAPEFEVSGAPEWDADSADKK